MNGGQQAVPVANVHDTGGVTTEKMSGSARRAACAVVDELERAVPLGSALELAAHAN
jgi:hypothetical protein